MSLDAPLVLIVENDAILALFYEGLLRREGFRTAIVPAAAEAMRALGAEPPAAAIVDLRLRDGEDGRPVAESLAERQVPVIIASAYGHTLEPGFLDHVRPTAILRKPASARELLTAIRGAIGRQ